MAKYDITHSCGHTITHQICGTNVRGERDSKKTWLESRDCSECYRKAQADKAAADNQDLPALSGSAKQVAWAETIRAASKKSLEEARNIINPDHPKAAEVADLIDATLAKTEARYWIDNRGIAFDARWIAKQITQ